MGEISRRKLITTGLTVAAGASGVAVAAKLAQRNGLIPPDARTVYGAGETLTYAAQRVLTRHSMAREFSHSQISKDPFANEVDNLGDEFKRLQTGNFAALVHSRPRGHIAAGALRRLPLVPEGLVGEHRHGRRPAPADARRHGHERRRPSCAFWRPVAPACPAATGI